MTTCMAAKKKARVLVIDNDAQVREDLEEILAGYDFDVRAPLGAADELKRGALEMARSFRPHVAVVDLRLVDDSVDQVDGLELLEDLKPARCIVLSAYLNLNTAHDAVIKYHAADFIQKSERVEKLVNAIEKAALEVSAARWGMTFGGNPACSPGLIMERLRLFDPHAEAGKDLPEDLLRILFPEEKHILLGSVEGGPVLSTPILRGRTVVLTAQRQGKLEVELVKFAPAVKIAKEVSNYNQHIHLNLGGHFRPNLENHAAFYELGGAVYSFLGYNESEQQKKPMQTLAQAYLNNRQADLVRPLDHFFKEVWRGLYQQSHPRPVTPFAAYDACLGLTRKLDRARRGPHWEAHYGAPVIQVAGLEQPLPNPFAWLLQNRDRRARSGPLFFAITHGDLHAGNLLIDEACQHAWTIDFERTGEGPILRDFVELEVDIATRLVDAANPDPRDFLELAAALCAPAKTGAPLTCTSKMNAEIERGMALIQHLRALAEEVTGVFDAWEYTWGLLCDAVFVALVEAPGTPRYERAVMLAAVACESLEEG